MNGLSDEERAQALARFELPRPFLEDGVPLAVIAREHALALRTARRWVKRYRSDGLAGLVRKTRADRGSRRVSPLIQGKTAAPGGSHPARRRLHRPRARRAGA